MNIAAAAENFLAARALVREARSQYFPTLATNPEHYQCTPIARAIWRTASRKPLQGGISVQSYTDYSLPFDASWEPDLWGRIRSTVRANISAAQASAADLENVRSSVQAELAVDYYELRAQDSLKEDLDSTVTAYQDTYDLIAAFIAPVSGPMKRWRKPRPSSKRQKRRIRTSAYSVPSMSMRSLF